MRAPVTGGYDRGKDVEKFSGDEPDAAMKFLEHDINGQDNAEANYGVIGVAIHRGTDLRWSRLPTWTPKRLSSIASSTSPKDPRLVTLHGITRISGLLRIRMHWHYICP